MAVRNVSAVKKDTQCAEIRALGSQGMARKKVQLQDGYAQKTGYAQRDGLSAFHCCR